METSTRRLEKALELSPLGMMVLNSSKEITYANETAAFIFHTPVDVLETQSINKLDQSEDVIEQLTKLTTECLQNKTSKVTRLAIMSGAGIRYYMLEAKLDAASQSVLMYFNDVTDLVSTEEALQEQASHDSLTGLFNRQQLFTMGAQDIARSKRYEFPLSLLLVSIDNIRAINQTYGYNMGDHALVTVARTLHGMLRESDYVARLDNKSFVISLIDSTLEQTRTVAHRVQKAISEQQLSIADIHIEMDIICGAAQFDSKVDHQFDDLLLRAENDGQTDT